MREFDSYEKKILHRIRNIDKIPGEFNNLGKIISEDLPYDIYVLNIKDHAIKIPTTIVEKYSINKWDINDFVKRLNNRIITTVNLFKYLIEIGEISLTDNIEFNILGRKKMGLHYFDFDFENNDILKEIFILSKKRIILQENLIKHVDNNFKTEKELSDERELKRIEEIKNRQISHKLKKKLNLFFDKIHDFYSYHKTLTIWMLVLIGIIISCFIVYFIPIVFFIILGVLQRFFFIDVASGSSRSSIPSFSNFPFTSQGDSSYEGTLADPQAWFFPDIIFFTIMKSLALTVISMFIGLIYVLLFYLILSKGLFTIFLDNIHFTSTGMHFVLVARGIFIGSCLGLLIGWIIAFIRSIIIYNELNIRLLLAIIPVGAYTYFGYWLIFCFPWK
jgi:hypothetical protein